MQQERQARAGQLQAFQTLCTDLGESPSNIALAWLLHQPGVSATIIGPGNIEQLTSTLRVPDISLSTDSLTKIDEIFPPCGAAPEAYAW